MDDNLVTIPNSQFINNAVASGNAGALDMMIENKFLVSIHSDIKLIKETLREIVVTSRFAYLKKPVNVIVSEKVIGNLLALEFNVKAYVFDVHYEKAFSSDIFSRGNTRLRELEIQRPVPIGFSPN